MSSSGTQPSFERRWERVARSYLRPAPAGRFTVAVAGPDDAGRVHALAASLRRCVSAMGMEEKSPRTEEGRESGRQGDAPRAWVEILDLGMVDEERLGLLAREESIPIDLLVWQAPPEAPDGPRALYLLGVFGWAKAPESLVCLLSADVEMEAKLSLLDEAGLSVPLEFHRVAEASSADRVHSPPLSAPRPGPDRAGAGYDPIDLTGILQAALARADARLRSSFS